MSVTAYVITDGSHDGQLKVGGVAGKIVIEGQGDVSNFKKPIFNAYDSTVVEYLAIKEALDIIEQKKRSGIKVDKIVFATDSMDLICAIDPQQVRDNFPKSIPFIAKARRYQKMTNQLVERIKGMDMTFDLQKVKAHVPENEATVVEKIHNEVDIMAKEPKDRVVASLQPHNLTKGRYFSVLIPRDLSEEKFELIRRSSLKLIQQGFTPRVVIQAGADNPVLKAYDDYSEVVGVAVANHQRKHLKTYVATERNGSEPRSITGLNRARARHWLIKEGKEVDEWTLNGFEGAVMNDIIMSSLGSSHPAKQISQPNYKGQFCAKSVNFVLHHGDEHKMPEHSDVLDRVIKTYRMERELAINFVEKKKGKDMETAFAGLNH